MAYIENAFRRGCSTSLPDGATPAEIRRAVADMLNVATSDLVEHPVTEYDPLTYTAERFTGERFITVAAKVYTKERAANHLRLLFDHYVKTNPHLAGPDEPRLILRDASILLAEPGTEHYSILAGITVFNKVLTCGDERDSQTYYPIIRRSEIDVADALLVTT